MESLESGTLAGTGSFRCERCGYVVTLAAADTLPRCTGCGGEQFVRASLFGDTRFTRELELGPGPEQRAAMLAEARESIAEAGDYLTFLDAGGTQRTVALSREWTRIGRSLAADVRFDDPTVSRRHALVVRQPDGVRVLDDRSLNGVFIDGERVESRTLTDGVAFIVGRYLLHFLSVAPAEVAARGGALKAG